MPSPTPVTEFAVGDAVVGIHPDSDYLGTVGEITRVQERYNGRPDQLRYEVLWTGESTSKLYRGASLGAAPRALSRVPHKTKTGRRGRKTIRTRTFELSPTPRRNRVRALRPAHRTPL